MGTDVADGLFAQEAKEGSECLLDSLCYLCVLL